MVNKMLRSVCAAVFLIASAAIAPDFAQESAWMTKINQKIADTQSLPRIAQVRKIEGTTVMRVKLDGFGMIMGYEVATSSGSDILDQAAQNCLDRIGQFTAPPGNQSQTLLLKIVWKAG